MKRKSPVFLPLMCALLAVGVGAAAWVFLHEAPASESGVVNAEAPRSPGAAAPADSARPELHAVGAHETEEKRAPAEAIKDRKLVATPAEAELADALWLDGRVVFPEGTPVGERVEVVAGGRKFKTRPPYRAPVEPDGSFRVAFAPGTKSGSLDIDAPHLYLSQKVAVKPADTRRTSEIVLEPALGGRIQGRLILPAGAPSSAAASLVGKSVHAEGWSEDYDGNASRTGEVDPSLRFELRGLPAKCEYGVWFDSEQFVTLRLDKVRVQAGETLAQECALSWGARASGHVRDASGVLPEAITLWAASADEALDEQDATNERIQVEPDGRFEARGLRPGKVSLAATAKQRLPATLELGELKEGEAKEGVELLLQLGAQIGGRVLWPDGTPAVDARVQVQQLVESNELDPDAEPYTRDVATARTNAQGEFRVSGLAAAKHSISAQAKPEAEPTTARGAKGKQQAWRASQADVAADTLDVELKLQGGSTIHGIVLDDTGAPVKRFGVSAALVDDERDDALPRSVSSVYATTDGRFELAGLQDRLYNVEISAPGHDDPESQEVQVPAVGALAFVATRRSTISGVVLRPDGTPAARAEVRAGGATTTSNARGEFTVKSAATGGVRLKARLEGFASSEALDVSTAPGESLANQCLRLRAGGKITGEIHALRAGERLAGRSIKGHGSGDDGGYCSATTDAKGRFVIEHVDPGEYALALEPSDEQVAALGAEDWDWDLRRDLDRHADASVRDGATTHVVFSAPAQASVALAGTVRRGGEPAAGVRVRAERLDDDRRELQFALSDERGRYELTVNGPGRYAIRAQPGGSDGTRVGRTVTVPAGGLRDVDLALSSGRIAGSAVGPDGAELLSVHASLYWRGRPDEGQVEPQNAEGWGSDFDFRDLPPGKYTLVVDARARFEKPRRGEPREEPPELGTVRREISLAEGEELEGLKIEMALGGTLIVHVQHADGSSGGDGWIDLRRADAASTVGFDSYYGGSFEESTIETGLYDVRALTDSHVSATARIEIVAGQTRETTLVLGAGGRLKPVVVDADGAPVAARVQVYDAQGRALLARAADAAEPVGPLPLGECRVEALDGAGRKAVARAEVAADEVRSVALVLQ